MANHTDLEIAVIGMAGRFPGAGDIGTFWHNLRNGVESVRRFTNEELIVEGEDPEILHDPSYVKAASILEGKEYFDSAFFNYRPDEAKLMDPQMRIFHECVWEAIEDAGCDPGDKKNKIGLFAGGAVNLSWQAYWTIMNQGVLVDSFSESQLTNVRFLPTRISYALGLEGPSLFVDTACSTSLVAIHMACRSLLLAECHIGIAGGVTLTNKSKRGYRYTDGMILSRDGCCRAFDASASGFVNGEGAAVVVLKTLKNALRDRDNIWAVIKGSAINNDGNIKVGYSAPSIDGQTEAILAAQKWAKVEPESIGYIEANSSGSRLGDPIEVASLNRVFGPSANKYCAIGSVKTNIGNLQVAAGGASFIKAVLCLKSGQIPPSLHFAEPNPEVAFDGSPFYVNTELKEWTTGKYPLRAGVSGFGIGGTNAHVILEEAPTLQEAPTREDAGTVRDCQLFIYSARSAAALKGNIARQLNYLEGPEERRLADIAYTLQTGRVHFPYRHMLVAGSKEEAIDLLKLAASIDESALTSTPDRSPRLIFMFPGQGSPYARMCRDLYEQESVFRRQVDLCCELVRARFKKDLLPILFPEEGGGSIIDQPEFIQPALFIVEYALARLLISWGIKPDVMIGYGMGEYAAACISGTLSVEDAISQVVKPGELIQKTPEEQTVGDEDVRFSEGIGKHLLYPRSIFIEVGPGRVLGSLVSSHEKKLPGHAVVSLVKQTHEKGSDIRHLLQGLGELWKSGVTIDWQAYYSAEQRRKLSLPAYAFEKTVYKADVELGEILANASPGNGYAPRMEKLTTGFDGGVAELQGFDDKAQKMLFIIREFFGKPDIGPEDNFFELGGDSLKAMTFVARINRAIDGDLSITDLYKYPSIASLVEMPEADSTGEGRAMIPPPASSIAPAAPQPYYILSSAQKRMYLHQQMNKDSVVYNIFQLLRMEGELDAGRLEDTFRKLVGRHEVMRTGFLFLDEAPVQVISAEQEHHLEHYVCDEAGVEDCFRSFIRPFDLSQPPLFRVGLIHLSPMEHILMVDMHHIITDGLSNGILIKEFMALYGQECLPALRLQYKDYAQWQQSPREQEKIAGQKSFWVKEFSTEVIPLELPTDHPRPPIRGEKAGSVHFSIDKERTRELREMAKSMGASLFMIVLALYNALLARLSNQEDIVVGIPAAGRPHADLEKIFGMFVNTLAIRNFPEGHLPFSHFLAAVRAKMMEILRNQEYQYEDLIDAVQAIRDPSRNPLFDVWLSYQNYEEPPLEIPGLKMSPFFSRYQTAKYDLVLEVWETDEGLRLNLVFDKALFEEETANRFAAYLLRIADQVIRDPQCRLSDIDILPEEERYRLLEGYNRGRLVGEERRGFASGERRGLASEERRGLVSGERRGLVELLSGQVMRGPERCAVVFGEDRLTYAELWELSDAVAEVVRRLRGDSEIVGMYMEPGVWMVAGMVGIWKAGCGFLPLESGQGRERQERILRDSGCRLLLTEREYQGKLGFEGKQWAVDGEVGLPEREKEGCREGSGELAYVIYTSGSTGEPKGVKITGKNLVNYIGWVQRSLGLTSSDRTVLTSSYEVDLGYTSLFPVLFSGGELHLLSREQYRSPSELLGYIRDAGISYVKMTPSLFTTLAGAPGFEGYGLGELRYVVLGGERIRVGDIDRAHRAYGHIRFMNHYGPTETTIGAIAGEIEDWEGYMARPDIGRPIDGNGVYILDRSGGLLPEGVVGEIGIGGAGVSAGYLGREELTKDRFIEVDWLGGGRVYRTGDLGRWLKGGRIEYLGRMDQQVKIRGYRVELGEIEARLLGYPGIGSSAVVARQQGEDSYLAGYYVSEEEVEEEWLRRWLTSGLPDYMVPTVLVRLESLPLTRNGKLDVKALPEAGMTNEQSHVPPSNEIEEKLLEIWSEVLKIDKEMIGMSSGFFELGGHSIKAMTLANKIEKDLNVTIAVRDILRRSTIREQAAFIKAKEWIIGDKASRTGENVEITLV